MNELEIFRYALFPSGASYSDAELKKRVDESIYEINLLLGDASDSYDYLISFSFMNDTEHLWLVAIAKNAIQLPLNLNFEREKITQFALRVQERVSSLPVLLNSIALEIDAQRISEDNLLSDEKPLATLLVKESGGRRKIKIHGYSQEVLFPDCNPFRIDPKPRLIKFKIKSLSKYEGVIYDVDDPIASIAKNTKLPLVFGSGKFNHQVFSRLADKLYFGEYAKLLLYANVDILEGSTVEYHYFSEYLSELHISLVNR